MLNISRFLFLLALLISGWLAKDSINASVGCHGGGDCSTVVTSQWAKVLGIPIALVGVLTYLAMVIVSFCRPFQDRIAGAISATLCFLVIGSALWFIALQAVIIKSFCPYCCVIHALATIGSLLYLALLFKKSESMVSPIIPILISFSLISALVVLQFFAPKGSQAVTTSTEHHKHGAVETPQLFIPVPLTLVGGTVTPKYDLDKIVIGKRSTTPVYLALLSDWTCEYCHNLYAKLDEIEAPDGIRYEITILPLHNSPESKAMQETMLRLKRASSSHYEDISLELIHGVLEANSQAVKARLEELHHNPEISAKATYNPELEITEALTIAQAQFDFNRKSLHLESVPQLFSPTSALTGNPTTEEIQQFLEKVITEQTK